jgi:hypothetical protein
MAEAFQRNHTVSAGYLRRFTKNGVVTVHHLTRGTREDGPKAVGFQENLWGPEKLARTVEDAFGRARTLVCEQCDVFRSSGHWTHLIALR